MRGRAVPISPARRLVIDFMRFSVGVPMVVVQRRVRMPGLAAARAAASDRPTWLAIFTKAYGLVTREFPEFRRAYVKLPWPHFYESTQSVAFVAIEREYLGEPALFMVRVRDPGGLPLRTVGRTIRDAQNARIEEVPEFRRLVAANTLPLPLRRLLWWIALNVGKQRVKFFGTFGITSVSQLGTESLHTLSPQPTMFTYGVIADDGSVDIRLMWDHRIMDGVLVASALSRLEQILEGPMVEEMRSLSGAASEPAGSPARTIPADSQGGR